MLAREAGDRGGEARAVLELGLIALDGREGQRAARSFDRALIIFAQIGDDEGEAETLHALGVLHRLEGHGEQSRACLNRAMRLYRSGADQVGRAHAAGELAQVLAADGELRRATGLLRRATQWVGGADLALIQYWLGLLLGSCGHDVAAVESLKIALHCCVTTRDPIGETAVNYALGAAFLRQDQPERAKAAFMRSRRAATRIGDGRGRAEAQYQLALIHDREGFRARAVRELRVALTDHERIDNADGCSKVLATIGKLDPRVHYQERDLTALRRALGRYERTGNTAAQAIAHLALAVLLYEQGRYRIAARHNQRANELSPRDR